MKILLLIFLLNLTFPSEQHHDDSHKHHDEESLKAIGQGNALVEVDKEKGFKLSHEAFKTLGIKLRKISSKESRIPKSSLVTYENKIGVYVFRDGFFKMLRVSLKQEVNNHFVVEILELEKNDKVVTHGVNLLRVTDIFSTDKSEYAHSH